MRRWESEKERGTKSYEIFCYLCFVGNDVTLHSSITNHSNEKYTDTFREQFDGIMQFVLLIVVFGVVIIIAFLVVVVCCSDSSTYACIESNIETKRTTAYTAIGTATKATKSGTKLHKALSWMNSQHISLHILRYRLCRRAEPAIWMHLCCPVCAIHIQTTLTESLFPSCMPYIVVFNHSTPASPSPSSTTIISDEQYHRVHRSNEMRKKTDEIVLSKQTSERNGRDGITNKQQQQKKHPSPITQ